VVGRFQHKGLQRLYENDDASRLSAEHVKRIRLILSALDAAREPRDLDVHNFHLHALKGPLEGFWAVTVRANWRVIFRFENGNALDI
jgi:toxin HigB-1